MAIQRRSGEWWVKTNLKETFSLLRQDSLLLGLVCKWLVAFPDYVSCGATCATRVATAGSRCDVCVRSHDGNSCLQGEKKELVR